MEVVCYITTDVDRAIAKKLGYTGRGYKGKWTPKYIMRLRALYDGKMNGNNLISDEDFENYKQDSKSLDISAKADKLLAWTYAEAKRRNTNISSNITNVAKAYKELRAIIPAAMRKDIIESLAYKFSLKVDEMLENSDISRESFINGFTTVSGQFVGGYFNILNDLYTDINTAACNYKSLWESIKDNNDEAYKHLEEWKAEGQVSSTTSIQEFRELVSSLYEGHITTLKYWEQFMPFVLKRLSNTEGVLMGLHAKFAEKDSAFTESLSSIEDKWEISESKRDGWMEKDAQTSVYESLGLKVRRAISSIKIRERRIIQNPNNPALNRIETVEKRGVLGTPLFEDPSTVHQRLSELLRGIVDSNDMMRVLDKHSKNDTTCAMLLEMCKQNPSFRTQLFVDLKNAFVPFSETFEKSRGRGMGTIISRVLNRQGNSVFKKFKTLVLSKKAPISPLASTWFSNPSASLIFDPQTKRINWDNFHNVREEVMMWCKFNKNTKSTLIFEENPSFNGKAYSDADKVRFITNVCASLGLDTTVDAIDSLVHSDDLSAFVDCLNVVFGTNMTDNTPASKSPGLLGALSSDTFTAAKRALIHGTEGLTKGKQWITEDSEDRLVMSTLMKSYNKSKLEKLCGLLAKHGIEHRMENRVRYQDKTLYSTTTSSYLSDKMAKIESFVKNNNKEGLKEYIKDKFLNCPLYVDDEYLATDGQRGKILNAWLRSLIEACDSSKPLSNTVASIYGYERALGHGDKESEDFTPRDHMANMFVNYFRNEYQVHGYDVERTEDGTIKSFSLAGIYPMFVLGDAEALKYISAPRITTTSKDRDQNRFTTDFDGDAQDRITEEFYNVFLSERRRMAIDKANAKAGFYTYQNGKIVKPKERFEYLTFLNSDSSEAAKEWNLNENELKDERKVKAAIKAYLKAAAITGYTNLAGQKILSFKQRMENTGLLTTYTYTKGKETIASYKYLNQIAIPKVVIDDKGKSSLNEEALDNKIMDFYWNTSLATVQQMQVMTVDTSYYDGSKNVQKRYKGTHASGKGLDIFAVDANGNRYSEDGIERCVYFEDITHNLEELDPAFMEVILRTYASEDKKNEVEGAIKRGIITPLKANSKEEKERNAKLKSLLGENFSIYDSYKKVTQTDGQAYRSLNSYRKVMGMAGRWTEEMESAYNRIMEIREAHRKSGTDITEEEIEDLEHLALILQPIKPYMFTQEKRGITQEINGQQVATTQLIPIEHKYAEALIIPELLPKGNKLRDLAEWMEDNNVDIVGSTKIGKVGVWGQTELKGVTNTEELRAALNKAVIHQLPYEDYRIQNNIPPHLDVLRLFGTQIRKLIMGGLNMVGGYESYLPNVESIKIARNQPKQKLTGANLLAFYNSLHCANILDSQAVFENNTADINKLSELLQQSTIGSNREAMDNIFSYVVAGNEEGFKNFIIPLFEGGLEHDSAALMLSTFRKIVNKQQIAGGAAVQVSAFGINAYKEDGGLRYVTDPNNNSNILYAEIEIPFDLSYTLTQKNSRGEVIRKSKVMLDFNTYCNTDGTLKPSKEEISKDSPEYKKYQSYTYKEVDGKLVPCDYNDEEAKVFKPQVEVEYPDILNIVSYRIPTERDYSMINCRIKRFSPKIGGGTIKVPTQGTTIAGFDFDIDKLYFMRRSFSSTLIKNTFTESHFTKKQLATIWEKIYEDNPEIKDALAFIKLKQWNEANTDADKETIEHTSLNKFWGGLSAEIKEKYNKNSLFSDAAMALGEEPHMSYEEKKKYYIPDTYDFDKCPEDNTKENRNNMLITLISARLEDPETMKQRYTPGGFANASKAAKALRVLLYGNNIEVSNSKPFSEIMDNIDNLPDPEPNFNIMDPYTIIHYYQQNQLAAKLIGIMANQNAHHSFCSNLAKFSLTEDALNSISFCNRKYGDFIHRNDPILAERCNLQVAELLAASVDAVKDPVLPFLNLNTITADAGATLARLGYSFEEIGLLFNQPIIKDVCNEALNRGVKVDTVIADRLSTLGNQNISQLQNINLDANTLGAAIIEYKNHMLSKDGTDESYYKDVQNKAVQLEVLKKFNNILKVSQDVSDFVLTTKFTASNSVKSTFGGMYNQQLRTEKFIEKFASLKDDKTKPNLSFEIALYSDNEIEGPIDTSEDILNLSMEDTHEYLEKIRYNPFAYEQVMYDANRRAIKALNKNYYPYDNDIYRICRKALGGLVNYGILSEDDINNIHNQLTVAMLAHQVGSCFDGEAQYIDGEGNTHMISNRNYYTKVFPMKLANFLEEHPDIAAAKIFEYLSASVDTKKDANDKDVIDPKTKKPILEYSLDFDNTGQLGPEAKEDIRQSWESLVAKNDNFAFKNPEAATIGRELFMYCFYRMGFGFHPISFMHLAPTEVKDSISITNGDNVWNTTESAESVIDSGREVIDCDSYPNQIITIDAEVQKEKHLNFDIEDIDTITTLINYAALHPEYTFVIQKDLDEEDMQKFYKSECGLDIPSNIKFSENTLAMVRNSQEMQEAIQYGTTKSYRQFLYEVLKGNDEGIDSTDFSIQFILNNLDNPRFILDTSKSTRDIQNLCKGLNLEAPNIRLDITNAISANRMASYSRLCTVIPITEGYQYKWAPCLLINGNYYVHSSYINKDVITVDGVADYIKVEPLGNSKTIVYNDANSVKKPGMQYKSSLTATLDFEEDASEYDILNPKNSTNKTKSNTGGGLVKPIKNTPKTVEVSEEEAKNGATAKGVTKEGKPSPFPINISKQGMAVRPEGQSEGGNTVDTDAILRDSIMQNAKELLTICSQNLFKIEDGANMIVKLSQVTFGAITDMQEMVSIIAEAKNKIDSFKDAEGKTIC